MVKIIRPLWNWNWQSCQIFDSLLFTPPTFFTPCRKYAKSIFLPGIKIDRHHIYDSQVLISSKDFRNRRVAPSSCSQEKLDGRPFSHIVQGHSTLIKYERSLHTPSGSYLPINTPPKAMNWFIYFSEWEKPTASINSSTYPVYLHLNPFNLKIAPRGDDLTKTWFSCKS